LSPKRPPATVAPPAAEGDSACASCLARLELVERAEVAAEVLAAAGRRVVVGRLADGAE